MFRPVLGACCALALLACGLAAQTAPVVKEVEWSPFRAHCRDLLKGLDALKAPLPPSTVKAINDALVGGETTDPNAAGIVIQKLLDARCLVAVHINPESRVKANRGPAKLVLVRDQPTLMLVKVHNEGGVTTPLVVRSPQAVAKDKRNPRRWLEVAMVNDRPFVAKLSGRRLEYRVLRITARQTGKREATLAFDVGQGTEDLGFRAEVPILFTVKAPSTP
jgi:hypothetical protein